ncbi:UNVERIFIED_CONTAM: F-box protein [Sesamum calycinum]|uniref:F-box protein n=1 Tax=Sesamum calycinum TaxID=2727403 RepID=A0AAW2SYY0_9LAMI
MDYFEIDVISNVLGFLNNPADLIRASAVSRSWRHHVVANGLCKKLWLRKFPQVANVAYAVEDSDGIIKLSNISSGNPENWEALKRDHKIYSFLLQPLAKPIICPKDCLGFPIGASSTDHDLAENVINTLTPIDRYPGGASYWSSKGERDPNVPENILYRLITSISIVTEVHIRPFQAFWEPGRPVYSPKSVRFRLGRPKFMEDVEIDVCPVQQPSVDKYIWTYTSPVFPMAQESCLQQFKLPEPVVCVGGIFQIELFGRSGRGPLDGLFYIWGAAAEVLSSCSRRSHRSFAGERSSSVDEAESERLLQRAELLLEEMAEEILDEWD